jgi:hypothetical protein
MYKNLKLNLEVGEEKKRAVAAAVVVADQILTILYNPRRTTNYLCYQKSSLSKC